MAVTNTDETTVVDDDKKVTEEDLHDLKYPKDEVETSQEADEASEGEETSEDSEETGESDGQTETGAEDEATEETQTTESAEEPSEFVKEFPNIKGDTPEEYRRNLEIAYKNSTTEALRLKALTDASTEQADIGETLPAEADVEPSSYLELYAKQQLEEDITNAYADFSKDYSTQIQDPAEYAKFVRTTATLSKTIQESEKRVAKPGELYTKAAIILGWPSESAPTSKDKLDAALKDSASTTKTTSATKKVPKSKVTDQMVAVNRAMYPNKTDDEIRTELEPYV